MKCKRLILVLPFFLLIVTAYAQSNETYPQTPDSTAQKLPFFKPFAVGIVPTTLIAPDPRLRVSMAYRKDFWGISLDIAQSFYDGWEITTQNNLNLFAIRPEIRIYTYGPHFDNLVRQYAAIEGLYKFVSSELNGVEVTYKENGVQFNEIYVDRADYSAQEMAIGIKYGAEVKIAENFFFDAYVGLAYAAYEDDISNAVPGDRPFFGSVAEIKEGDNPHVNFLLGFRCMYAFDF